MTAVNEPDPPTTTLYPSITPKINAKLKAWHLVSGGAGTRDKPHLSKSKPEDTQDVHYNGGSRLSVSHNNGLVNKRGSGAGGRSATSLKPGNQLQHSNSKSDVMKNSQHVGRSSTTLDGKDLSMLYKLERAQNPELAKLKDTAPRSRFDGSLDSIKGSAGTSRRNSAYGNKSRDSIQFTLSPLQFSEHAGKYSSIHRLKPDSTIDSVSPLHTQRGSFHAADSPKRSSVSRRRSSIETPDVHFNNMIGDHRRSSYHSDHSHYSNEHIERRRSSFDILHCHQRILMKVVAQSQSLQSLSSSNDEQRDDGNQSIPNLNKIGHEKKASFDNAMGDTVPDSQPPPPPVFKKNSALMGKISKRAEMAVRMLAKQAVRKQKIRKMWQWAIEKVVRMIQATNAISDKNFFDIQADLRMLEETHHRARKLGSGAINLAELGFKLDNFKVNSKPGGSTRVMAALVKHPENRTEEDVALLHVLINTLPSFSKYSDDTRLALGRVIMYSRFNSNRVIVKQNHVAQNFYYLMSGELEITKMVDQRICFVGHLQSGMVFGDLALLDENSRRSATVTASKESELLWLTREDFEAVLKDEIIQEIEERKKYIGGHPFFRQMGNEAINQLAKTAQTFNVAPETPVCAEGDNLPFVYIYGELSLCKVLPFCKVKVSNRNSSFIMHPYPLPEKVDAKNGVQIVSKLIHFARMKYDEFFGGAPAIATAGTPSQIATAGTICDVELLKQAQFTAITKSQVKYIGINKHAFIRELVGFPHLVKECIWRHLEVKKFFSDPRKIQELYLERRLWERHKDQVLSATLKKISEKSAEKASVNALTRELSEKSMRRLGSTNALSKSSLSIGNLRALSVGDLNKRTLAASRSLYKLEKELSCRIVSPERQASRFEKSLTCDDSPYASQCEGLSSSQALHSITTFSESVLSSFAPSTSDFEDPFDVEANVVKGAIEYRRASVNAHSISSRQPSIDTGPDIQPRMPQRSRAPSTTNDKSIMEAYQKSNTTRRRSSLQQSLMDHKRIMMSAVTESERQQQQQQQHHNYDRRDSNRDSIARILEQDPRQPLNDNNPAAAAVPVVQASRRITASNTASITVESLKDRMSRRTVVTVKQLAKQAKMKQRIRKLWKWAIDKVVRMAQATSAISTKTYFDSQANLDMIMMSSTPERNTKITRKKQFQLADLGFKLESYKITSKPGGSARIMSSLMKLPENRDEDDIRWINIFLSSLPALKKYSAPLRKSLSRVIQYSRFGSGRIILKQGHPAQHFYIIISGDVEVTKIADKRNFWICALGAGDIFGDTALINGGSHRTASVRATSDIELLWITREDFEDMLESDTKKVLADRKRFMAANSLLGQLSGEALSSLAETAITYEIPAETPIFAEGDTAAFIYLICEGECRITKVLDFEKIKPSARQNAYNFLAQNLAAATETSDTNEKVSKLVRCAKVREGEMFGAASALSTSGAPNQVATIGSICDIESLIKFPFSLISCTHVKYLGLNKHSFMRELIQKPDLVKESVRKHLELMKLLNTGTRLHDLFIEHRTWERYKVEVITKLEENIKEETRRRRLCL
ncbi:Cyclic nucleotide-binding domain-containing protein 2 [Chytriomyces hyalinus]|nr:Cyclic nucleotide-binding domain-containing protein 2 [Chytriomyces hyalinus]